MIQSYSHLTFVLPQTPSTTRAPAAMNQTAWRRYKQWSAEEAVVVVMLELEKEEEEEEMKKEERKEEEEEDSYSSTTTITTTIAIDLRLMKRGKERR